MAISALSETPVRVFAADGGVMALRWRIWISVHFARVRASFHIQRLRALKMMKASTLGHNGIG